MPIQNIRRLWRFIRRMYVSEVKVRMPWYLHRLYRQGMPFVRSFSSGEDAKLTVWPCPEDMSGPAAAGDRHHEYAYTVDAIVRFGLIGKELLDLGSSGSFLPGIMAALGCRVTCYDVRVWPMKWPNLIVKTGDLLAVDQGSFPMASFDAISCISTIEHLGLGRYGDAVEVDGDLAGMHRLKEVLKPGGLMILTVPFGRAEVAYPAHRIYDRARFNRLIDGMEVLDQRFYGPVERPGVFQPCSEEETAEITADNGYAVKCCVLCKPTVY